MFPNRVPMDRDTPSPELIHSFCMSAGVPKKEPIAYGEKPKVTVHGTHTDGRPTYNGVRPRSSRGSLTTLLSIPQCHAAFSTIPSPWLG